MKGPIVVVGDLLLDRDVRGVVSRLSPDAPVPVLTELSTVERPGGAGLAATLLACDGADVVLVAGVGVDPAGLLVRTLLAGTGVELVEIPYDGPTPEKIRFTSGAHQLLRMERGTGDGRFSEAPPHLRSVLERASAVLVSDYGRGATGVAAVRRELAAIAGRRPVVWDPHPRGATPVPGAVLVCPNRQEAAGFCARHGADLNGAPVADPEAVAAEARLLRSTWRALAVAITLGEHGALLADGSAEPVVVAARSTHSGDSCGAGDRFAATATSAFAGGASARQAVAQAVAQASDYVSAGGPAAIKLVTTVEATS